MMGAVSAVPAVMIISMVVVTAAVRDVMVRSAMIIAAGLGHV
jgi:hypothetical protein